MKPLILICLLTFSAFGQSRSFWTDQPDIFGSDVSIGAGGTAIAPTRATNTTKSFTLFAPLFTSENGRGTFPSVSFTDDGSNRSLYLGGSGGGLTDFRIYSSSYETPTSGATAFSVSATGISRFEFPAVFVANARPSADNAVDLGSSSFSWRDIWSDGDLLVGGGGKMQFQGRTRIESGSDGVLAIRNAAAGTMTRILFGPGDNTAPALSFSGTTVQATDGLGALTTFSASTIELGNASDTTIARSGSGRVSIEGNDIITAATIISGTGSPEGVVTAVVGRLYLRTDGGVGTTLYVKESGSGNTGWAAK